MTVSRAVRRDLDGMKILCSKPARKILPAQSKTTQAGSWPMLLNHLNQKRVEMRAFVGEKKFLVDEVSNRGK